MPLRNSKALWLPVIWMALAGSRSVSQWFLPGGKIADTDIGVQATVEGNPADAAIIGVLALLGIAVLLSRRKQSIGYLRAITPIIIYSVYCLVSVAWAPNHVPALKRWTKDLGDVVMALIICTDGQPLVAVRSLYLRVGSILFPLSLYLIYFTDLGSGSDGARIVYTGVTTNKNVLGVVCYAVSLGVLWSVRWLHIKKGEPSRGPRLAGGWVLLVFGLALLLMSHSSTSLAAFLVGSVIMLATSLPAIGNRPFRVHLLCGVFILAGAGGYLLGGSGHLANALGRDGSLSGRTDMWAAMFPAVSNPLTGVGFDSFWTSPNAVVFHHNLNALHWFHSERINEAHNGYIEVYLNLGWIGVCLIAAILITGYWRAGKAFQRNRELGSLMLGYIISGAIYSITEAGFRTLSPLWICILLAVVSASGANAGLFGDETTDRSRRHKGHGHSGFGWQSGQPSRESDTGGPDWTAVMTPLGAPSRTMDNSGWGHA